MKVKESKERVNMAGVNARVNTDTENLSTALNDLQMSQASDSSDTVTYQYR